MTDRSADSALRRPPRLRPGARVAVVAPAGPVTEERVTAAIAQLELLGLEPVPGRSIRDRARGYLAGTDDARRADLQHAFDRNDVDAVWAIRGGYGAMRLLHGLDLDGVRRRPRAFVGFSDNTAIHLALRHAGLVCFHGPHPGVEWTAVTERCVRQVLFEAGPAGVLPAADHPVHTLSPGTAQGRLVGGNLALLAALCGTPFQPHAAGAILFIEEIGEEAYRVDRLWTQLELAGVLEGVAGIAIGRFTDCGGGPWELVHELAAPLGVPVVAGLPIGHEPDNWTLPLGIDARLDADAGTLELLESAVAE